MLDIAGGEDVEMQDVNTTGGRVNGKNVIVGSSELNYKRDNMEI